MSTPLVEQEPFNGHTPLPWTIEPHTTIDKLFRVGPATIDYDDVDHEEEDANAEFIAYACNTFYQREAELQSMRDCLSRMEAALRRAQESICYAMEEGVDIGGTGYIDEALSNK